MIKKITSDFQVPTYEEFKDKMRPLAMNIAKSQNLRFATFSDEERVEMALDNAYMKINRYNPQKGVKLTTFFYKVIKNELCTIQPYDKNLNSQKSSKKGKEDPVVIVSMSDFNDHNMGKQNPIENMPEEESEDASFEHMEEFSQSLDCPGGCNLNPYNKEDCFILAFTTAMKDLSEKDKLILTGNKREYVTVKGQLRDDQQAWDDYYFHNKGTVVFRGLSSSEIGKIFNYTAENVRNKKNTLANKLAVSMSKIFATLYLGENPQRTFWKMLKQFKGGKLIVKNNNLSL